MSQPRNIRRIPDFGGMAEVHREFTNGEPGWSDTMRADLTETEGDDTLFQPLGHIPLSDLIDLATHFVAMRRDRSRGWL